MKSHRLITAVAIACLGLFSQANAEEKALRKDQVPKAVVESFEKAHPNATGVKFEEETFAGNVAYEATGLASAVFKSSSASVRFMG